jgi:hypothetical protein
MAIYPGARVRLLPENAEQPRITPTQAIAHTAVDGAYTTSLYDWFNGGTNLESHFYVAKDGTVEQYIDTEVRADANNKANVRAVSIETHDGWASTGNKGAVTTPWTPAQVAAIRLLLDWLCDTHPIPRRAAPAWDLPGIGWHNQYPQWSPSPTGCPGPVRAAQLRDEIIPALTQEEDMTPEEHEALFDAVARLNDLQGHVKPPQGAPADAPTLYALAADSNAWKSFTGLTPTQIETAVREALGDGFDISITPKA